MRCLPIIMVVSAGLGLSCSNEKLETQVKNLEAKVEELAGKTKSLATDLELQADDLKDQKDSVTAELEKIREEFKKEAVAARPQRPARIRPDASAVYSVNIADAPFKGAKHAKVTIVETFEFA